MSQPAAKLDGGRRPDYEMSDRDFANIAKIALAEFGLSLPTSKKSLVFSRLTKRLRALNLADFSAYCDLLESGQNEAEKTELLTALTTNVTKFFRENHHFEYLHAKVLPELVSRAQGGGRVRIWSAGCSSGEEPYSIAMTLLDKCPSIASTDTKILATDIDPVILARAQRGCYDTKYLDNIPQSYRSWAIDRDAAAKDQFVMSRKVSGLITFGIANLVAELPVTGPFDVIFCRNVAIYFDKPTQALVWERFRRLLAPGATLCIGHSERLAGPAAAAFSTVGTTTYEKNKEPNS